MKGSCLCGKCVFEISDEPGLINKCHCVKCRKLSGAGSNAVFWLNPEELQWVAGEDVKKSFVMPDGWESVFCGECGSPLPRLIPDEEWIVPAGIIDGVVQSEVRAHIFVANKPSWEVIGDDAPQFETVPDEGGA
jgi:hypothetical protein